MDFNLSDDQRMLVDAVSRYLERAHGRLPGHADTTPGDHASRQQWAALAELGLLGLPFDEAHGGAGGGHVDIALVMQEFGKALVTQPYLASVVLAAALLERAASDALKARLVPHIADGSLRVAIAYEEANGTSPASWIETTYRSDRDGYVLQGEKKGVLAGFADALIVLARRHDGPACDDNFKLFLVPADAVGITHRRFLTVDASYVSEYAFDAVRVPPTDVICSGSATLSHLEYALDVGRVALCAEAVGIMDAMVRETVAYATGRKQFGLPIGSFQALQHKMVDMFVHAEQGRSSLWRALAHLDDDTHRADACAAVKTLVGIGARFVAQQAVQIHGGMGMSDEMKISHYFRRLTAIEQTLGNSATHLRRLARGVSASARC